METGRRLLDTTLIFNIDPNGGKPEKVCFYTFYDSAISHVTTKLNAITVIADLFSLGDSLSTSSFLRLTVICFFPPHSQ